MLGARHGHATRVIALLSAARDALVDQGHEHGLGKAKLGIEVILTAAQEPLSNSTNYLGGITDVLESKARRGAAVPRWRI